MKKKIISLCLVIALVAIAVTGATFAYLQDADADSNVMVAGDVWIVENETDRDGNAWGGENDTMHLNPAVFYEDGADGDLVPYTPAQATENPYKYFEMADTDGEGTTKMWDKDYIRNSVDKIVTVTNNGTEAAYVRTIVLLEVEPDMVDVNINSNGGDNTWEYLEETVIIDEVEYNIWVCTYETAIEAGATSAPSLKEVYLSPLAGNEWYKTVGTYWTVLTLSQAVQADGFEAAGEALDLAFGDVTAENVATWYAQTNKDTTGLDNVIS